MKKKLFDSFHTLSLISVPAIVVIFAVIYRTDRQLYLYLLAEDLWVEWFTCVFLLISAILSLSLVIRIRSRSGFYHWFYIAFSIACIFFILEEMSWGQRLFGAESPEFFLKHSTQKEINIHNIMQSWSGFKTRLAAGWILIFYGTFLPLLSLNKKVKGFFDRCRFVIPPLVLSLGFFLSALMMIDKPTGQEEELGEFCFSLLFFLFMTLETLKLARRVNIFKI